VVIGSCAELSLREEQSLNWNVVWGVAWSLALWVSFYEPLFLFVIVLLFGLTKDRHSVLASNRRIGWICFGAVSTFAVLIERRVPTFAIFQLSPLFANWARTIGERAHVTAESNLVRLGRVPVCRRAGFNLVLVSQANRAA